MAYFLEDLLSDVKTVGMAGHVRPDGDAAGAVLAVYNYLREHYPGVEAHAYLEELPEAYRFMERSDEIETASPEATEAYDLFIVLDCGDSLRLGAAAGYFQRAKKTLCIDHHLSNDSFADVNYIYPEASATCELVYELIDPEKITLGIAECLYTGIITDTGVFQYDATSPKTMRIAGELMGRGIDYPGIIERTFFEKTYAQNRIMGQALVKAKLHDGGRIITSFISLEEEEAFGAKPSDYDGVAEQLRNTKDVIVSVFLHEMSKGRYKASTRASGDINLALLAKEYGGGGHAKAAGFTMEGPDPEALLLKIVEKVAAYLSELS